MFPNLAVINIFDELKKCLPKNINISLSRKQSIFFRELQETETEFENDRKTVEAN